MTHDEMQFELARDAMRELHANRRCIAAFGIPFVCAIYGGMYWAAWHWDQQFADWLMAYTNHYSAVLEWMAKAACWVVYFVCAVFLHDQSVAKMMRENQKAIDRNRGFADQIALAQSA